MRMYIESRNFRGVYRGGAPGARAPPKIFLVKKNRGQPFWNLFEHTGMIITDHPFMSLVTSFL